jgi:hypothetical protein
MASDPNVAKLNNKKIEAINVFMIFLTRDFDDLMEKFEAPLTNKGASTNT